MKTKNNVQKAILRSVAVIVSFVLISFTVSAQEFWKRLLENSSFNEIALAMVETPTEANNADTETEGFYYLLIEEKEHTLEMEEWMVDENYFGAPEFNFTLEAENSLQIEEWMLDASLFEVEEHNEKELELEAWMISDKHWKI